MGIMYQLILKEKDLREILHCWVPLHTHNHFTYRKLGKKENAGLISFGPRPLLERDLGTRLGLIAALSNRPTSCEIFMVIR